MRSQFRAEDIIDSASTSDFPQAWEARIREIVRDEIHQQAHESPVSSGQLQPDD